MKDQNFAVIFDMDGVMVDSNPYHQTSLQAFTKKHGFQLSNEQLIKEIYGRTNKDWITNLFKEPLSEQQIADYAQEKEAMFRQAFKDDIAPVAGLHAFLDLLEAAGVPVAIATSAPKENVDFVLDSLGLQGRFKVISDDASITHSKPHPEVYLLTAKKLGFPPERCFVFEDSVSGVAAGVAAGAKVIGLTTTHLGHQLDGTVLDIPFFEKLGLDQLRSLMNG